MLIGVASKRETISYMVLAARAELKWNYKSANDRKDFGRLLGDGSAAEYARGRPLLTAVVRDDTGKPGDGFLGLEGFPKTHEFWKTGLKRVHDSFIHASFRLDATRD